MELGKKVLQFIWGFFIGIIYYTIIFKNVHISQQIRYFILLFTCLTCALGSISSVQIRCISILSLPTFCGNSGKSIIRAWILVNLLEGPINNIAKNANEIVELTSCSVTLSYNLTKARFDLMLQPFLQASLRLKPDVSDINDILRHIDKMVEPLTEEIDGEKKNKSISTTTTNKIKKGLSNSVNEKVYLKKLEKRCNAQLSKSQKRCHSVFRNQQKQCLYNIPILIGAMYCLPFQLELMCNMSGVLGFDHICDPSMQIDSNVNEQHDKLLNDIQSLHDNLTNLKIAYKNNYVDPNVYIDDMKNASLIMVNKILEKKNIVKHLIDVIHNFASLLILKIIYDSQMYHNNYLKDVTFDNNFVTKYFRRIDKKRREQRKITLIQDKRILNQKKFEYVSLIKQLLKLSFEIVMASVLIIIDKLFYEALNVIRRHGRVEFMQKGVHTITVKIKGTGMMARLIKSMIKEFNLKKMYSALKSNTECLPEAFSLDDSFLYKIYAGYSMIFVFSLTQIHITRLHSSICGYFYPKREKFRSIYLYNEILRLRYKATKTIRNKVLKLSRQNRQSVVYRKYLRWLKYFATIKCWICETSEFKYLTMRKSVMRMCPSEMCGFVYCLDCWKAVGEVCHACKMYDMNDTRHSTDSSVVVFDTL